MDVFIGLVVEDGALGDEADAGVSFMGTDVMIRCLCIKNDAA